MPAATATTRPVNLDPAPRPLRLTAWIGPLEVIVGVLLTLASVCLHVFQRRAAGGLWRDEATSVQIAELPTFGQVWNYLEFDSYPPLFHVLLRGWHTLFSFNDASLRTLGLLIGVSVLACFWVSVRALGGRVPLFALVLLGLNPLMIRYGDSLRAYGLGCALALLTLVAVWNFTRADRPGWRRYALASVVAILGVQCLYHCAALLLAMCLGGAALALQRGRRARAAAVLAVGVPAALSLLPYLPIIARTRSWSGLLRFPVTPAWLWDKLSDVTGSPDPLGVWLWTGLVGLGVAWAAWTLRTGSPAAGSPARLFALTVLATSGLIYAGFLVTVGYVTQPWYYLMLLSVAAVCLDAIYGQTDAAPGWRVLRLVVAAALAVTTFGQDAEILRQRNTDIDLVAAQLNARVAPGDLVLVNRWECAVSLQRYYHGPAPLLTVPPISDHRAHRYDLFARCMAASDPLRSVFDAVGATLHRPGAHLWLVGHPLRQSPGATLDLPPLAVLPREGKSPFADYYYGWAMQANGFVVTHAARSTAIDVPVDAPVSPFENQDLWCFDGWQD